LLVLLLWPPTVVAQEDARVPSTCVLCEPQETVPQFLPGTVEARRAIFEPLGSPRADSLVALGPGAPQEASPPGCGTIALVAGAVTAAVGVLLAVVIESAFPWKDETSATSRYLVAGGVAFGVGATYAYVRCRIDRPEKRG
jgi:hypothetical protein